MACSMASEFSPSEAPLVGLLLVWSAALLCCFCCVVFVLCCFCGQRYLAPNLRKRRSAATSFSEVGLAQRRPARAASSPQEAPAAAAKSISHYTISLLVLFIGLTGVSDRQTADRHYERHANRLVRQRARERRAGSDEVRTERDRRDACLPTRQHCLPT